MRSVAGKIHGSNNYDYVGHLNNLESFLALIPMHQLRNEGGYKLNKSKLTLVQKSDSVLSCKK